MQRRQKAADVFRDTAFLLGEKTTFAKAFPRIEDIRVEVAETGDGVPPHRKKCLYGMSTAGEYIDCSNPMCFNGGFCLGQLIRFMVEQRKTDDSLALHCQGYEGSPKGRKKYGPCFNYFEANIHIEYKPEPATELTRP